MRKNIRRSWRLIRRALVSSCLRHVKRDCYASFRNRVYHGLLDRTRGRWCFQREGNWPLRLEKGFPPFINEIWAIIEALLLSPQQIPQKLGNTGPIFRLLVQTPPHGLSQFEVDVIILWCLKHPSICRLICSIMGNSLVRKLAKYSGHDRFHLSKKLEHFSGWS